MRVGVLASGSGTMLAAILEAGIPVTVVVLDGHCAATGIAEGHGLEAVLVERTNLGAVFGREAYTDEVIAVPHGHGIDRVVMPGFGTIFAKSIFDAYEARIINTRPALLPSFPGWHAVRDALA